MTKDNALELSQINFSYEGTHIFNNLSVQIKKGDFFIIIGPNGSGKTTLIKIIAGIIKPENGKLTVFDTPRKKYSRKVLAQYISYVPQVIQADFPFTVSELVLMGRAPYLGILGVETENDIVIAEKAIDITGIGHLKDRKLNQLSGGERQRAFIAKAICTDPKIILLDEPTAALDLSYQIHVMDLMEKLQQEMGLTVVMVSHDLNLAAMYADNVLLLNRNKTAVTGKPSRVLTYETLEKAYDCSLLVDENPLGKFPRITQIPGRYL